MGVYVRLVDYNSQQAKEDAFLSGSDRYVADSSNFSKIPGAPIAYWVSERMLNAFECGRLISIVATPKQGISTCDVNRFVKYWHEIDIEKTNVFDRKNHNGWVVYNKGGEFRRWYGNRDSVVLWHKNGDLLKNNNAALRNKDAYFKQFIAWSKISGSCTGFRDFENDFLFDGAGGSLFLNDNSNKFYFLGFLNSKICTCILNIISPTLNYNESHIGALPIILNSNSQGIVGKLVENNIKLAQHDWDSFETSWDFKKHPLI